MDFNSHSATQSLTNLVNSSSSNDGATASPIRSRWSSRPNNLKSSFVPFSGPGHVLNPEKSQFQKILNRFSIKKVAHSIASGVSNLAYTANSGISKVSHRIASSISSASHTLTSSALLTTKAFGRTVYRGLNVMLFLRNIQILTNKLENSVGRLWVNHTSSGKPKNIFQYTGVYVAVIAASITGTASRLFVSTIDSALHKPMDFADHLALMGYPVIPGHYYEQSKHDLVGRYVFGTHGVGSEVNPEAVFTGSAKYNLVKLAYKQVV